MGVSYAYFKARVSGEGKTISLRSKGIYVLYSGDATLASENISPGWSVTKEFTVENQGSNNEVYNIYIEGLVNTFVTSGYLQYKITSSNGYNMTEYKDIPKSNTSTDTVLAYSVPIKSKEKQTYKVELIYKETEEDQSVDMGKILSGILGIQVGTKDPNLFTASVVVINGSSDTNSKEVYKGNDVTFTITPNDGYTLEDASISCSNGTLTNNLLTITNVQSDVTCTITLGEESPIKKGTFAYQILQDNPTVKTRTDFSVSNTDTTTDTIYKTNNAEGNKDVYYFSGNSTNNWVKFAVWTTSRYSCFDSDSGWRNTQYSCSRSDTHKINLASSGDNMYWRIVRINEDGSVRLLYLGSSITTTDGYIGSSEYSTSDGNIINVGYMYGTSGSLSNNRNNTNDSPIKTVTDEWYQTHLLTNYDKYISKSAIYCNDRSTINNSYSLSSSFVFGARTRLSNHTPTYKCGGNGSSGLFESTQATADKFSSSTSGGGNGKLKYPIGQITSDEIIFAGGNSSRLSSPYTWYYNNSRGSYTISTQEHWWTMSPSEWDVDRSVISVYSIGSSRGAGSISSSLAIYSQVAVRPVISLKACVKYASGDGSSSNPYEVTIDSACENSEN